MIPRQHVQAAALPLTALPACLCSHCRNHDHLRCKGYRDLGRGQKGPCLCRRCERGKNQPPRYQVFIRETYWKTLTIHELSDQLRPMLKRGGDPVLARAATLLRSAIAEGWDDGEEWASADKGKLILCVLPDKVTP